MSSHKQMQERDGLASSDSPLAAPVSAAALERLGPLLPVTPNLDYDSKRTVFHRVNQNLRIYIELVLEVVVSWFCRPIREKRMHDLLPIRS